MAATLRERMDWAQRWAREAGQLTLRYFQTSDFEVERKDDDSPVTVADREAEQLLRQRIREQFPDDGILGEEFGEVDGSSSYRWILDPIDGTKSFVTGVPLYGTMVGLESEGQGVAGAVYIPGLDEMIYAARGAGAWHVRGQQPPVAARVSAVRSLRDGLFVTSQVDTFQRRDVQGVYRALEQAAFVTRTWGDCYGYLLVATGRAAVMVDPMLNVWDAAAVQPIVEEAGGRFTDWNGEPTIHAGEAIGMAPGVADEVLAVTRSARRL